MNKFSRTARSVTFAAIVGLSMGISAPAAIAQDSAVNQAAGDSPLVNKDAKGALTIHKYANPTELGQPSGTAADLPTGDKLDGVGFTAYKVNGVDLTTNEGLLAASQLKATDFVKNGKADETKVTKVSEGVTNKDGEWKVTKDGETKLDLGVYLIVETAPKAGYSPATPFLAFVPMTSNGSVTNQDGQISSSTDGQNWNYDVHAFPKNYSKVPPTKTVKDQDDNGKLDNVGDVVEYDINTQVRQIADGKRLNYYMVADVLDPNNFDVKADTTKITVFINNEAAPEDYYTVNKNDDNGFRVSFTAKGLQNLKSQDKVRVHVKAVKKSSDPIAPNKATEWEPKDPSTDQDVTSEQNPPENPEPGSGTETNEVRTYWGELQFKKVDSEGNALEGAEFEIYQVNNGMTCDAVDPKKAVEGVHKVSALLNDGAERTETFKSGQDGIVKVSGLHVNDFVNNKEVGEKDQTQYCLIETKAPKGKELLAEAISFKLVQATDEQGQPKVTTGVVKKETITWDEDESGNPVNVKTEVTDEQVDDFRVYEQVAVKYGDKDGEVVNLDDTTPNLPMTGGAGVGILAAIGAAIVAAGAWFARRGAKN